MQVLKQLSMGNVPETRTRQSKRFYIQKIRNHMRQIQDEIVSLTCTSSSVKTTRVSLTNERKIAKDRARTYIDYENQLSVFNLALEFFMARKTDPEIKRDISTVKEHNQSISTKLDTIFVCKSQHEEAKNDLLAETEELKQREDSVINNLSIEHVEEYKTLLDSNHKHLQVIAKLRQKIDETKRTLNALEAIQSLTTAKQARRRLLHEFNRYQREKVHFLNALTEMKGELCLRTVKNDKSEVEALHKAKTTLEEQVEAKENELAEIIKIIDSGKHETLEKYAKREKQVNEYMQRFDERISEVTNKVIQEQRRIETALDCLLSKDSQFINLDDSDDLRSKYKSITLQIRTLEMEEHKETNELISLQQQLSKMKSDSEAYLNLDSKLNELTYENQVLEEEQISLKTVLATFATDMEEAKERLNNLIFLLHENETYEEVCKYLKEAESLETRNEEMRNVIDSMEETSECNRISDDIDALLADCNNKIIKQLDKR